MSSQHDIHNKEHDQSANAKKVRLVDESGNAATLGSAEYATRWVMDGDYIYLGEADVGSITADSVWRVQRVDVSNGIVVYADGDANFDNIWDNYSSLSYS